MTKRKNPYPGVRKNIVKGRIYWRFEAGDFRYNLPGPYRSPEFLAAHEAALAGAKAPVTTTEPGAVAWLIEQYLGTCGSPICRCRASAPSGANWIGCGKLRASITSRGSMCSTSRH